MNEVVVKKENIRNMIYIIRSREVMLDVDLARLYECKNGTKDINKAVKRNINKFPNDFYFQLSEDEFENWFQNGTGSHTRLKHSSVLPHAFTEQGVAMLASVLKTDIANEMSVKIMRAFVIMRKYLSSTLLFNNDANNILINHENRILLLEETLNNFKEKTHEIYFDGQIYDAYSKILEIFKSAKKELIVIDSYADNTILDIIKRLNVNVTIITKENNLLTKMDLLKYNKQYHNLKVIYSNSFHDRYFILDKNTLYHCGTSVNRIGYKTFSITLISDNEIRDLLISKVKGLL